MKEKLLEKLINLIEVKNIVTLALTILFCVLAGRQVVDGNTVMAIYTTVIAFYFGTQAGKMTVKNESENKSDDK